MRFSIGGIFAKCSACKAEDFFPAQAFTGRRDVYVCAACSNQVVYSDLLAGIGKESVERAVKLGTDPISATARSQK
jgi:hypothetical protein